MKPIPVLGIPHYNRPDLLARCIASIDHPVEKLVIVLQGPEDREFLLFYKVKREIKLLRRGVPDHIHIIGNIPECIEDVVAIRHPNAGVAGAWNEIIKLFPGTGTEGTQGTQGAGQWWLISNNDIAFAPGDLEKMAEFVEWKTRTMGCIHMAYGNHGASWFAITAHGIATAGLFDENIYPAYLEDCDMSRRFDLLGLGRANVPDVHAIHGDAARGISGSTTVHSDPALSAKNARTHGGNFDYYRCKWGGINEQEVFKTPFNDPHWPIWAWKFDPAHRAEQQW